MQQHKIPLYLANISPLGDGAKIGSEFCINISRFCFAVVAETTVWTKGGKQVNQDWPL